MMRFDVAIIGGGPACSSLALSLRQRSLSVLVAERSDYQQWRPGEILSPDVRIPLSRLGVLDSLFEVPHLTSEAVHSSWGSSDLIEKHFVFNPYGSGWHLDRRKFDNALALAAEAHGATVLRGVSYVSAMHSNLWQITLRNESRTIQVEARFIVDATGRAAQVAKNQGSRLIFYDNLVSLIGVISPISLDTPVESVLTVEAGEEGWWYSAPLPDGTTLAAFMTDNDIFHHSREPPTAYWNRMLKRTEHLSGLMESGRLTDHVRIRNASTCRLDRIAGPDWIAVGDAACAFDPLAGNGILKALKSSIDLSEAILQRGSSEHHLLKAYADKTIGMFNEYLNERHHFYLKEQRWPEASFWTRRQFPIAISST